MSIPSTATHSEPAAAPSLSEKHPIWKQKPRDPERIARMHKLRDSGVSCHAIARRFGLHLNTVYYLLSRYPRERAA